jgi:6-pyruvoyltetrahydropterin/6-carboxytetrahydropterin synthase
MALVAANPQIHRHTLIARHMMRIYKDFGFEAAHFLPTAAAGHPNSRMHGHSFHVRVTIAGEPDPETGLIFHFGDLEEALGQVKKKLDHRCLNEIAGLQVPTLERIVKWIWEELEPAVPGLDEVHLSRPSCGEGCIYSGIRRTDTHSSTA